MRNLEKEIVKLFLRFLLLTLIFIFIVSGGHANTKEINLNELKSLNPNLEELIYPWTLSNFTFRVEQKSGRIEAVQTIYDFNQGWYPWFDQEEGRPEHIMVDGRLYSQHIYLATPEEGFERKLGSYRNVFNEESSDNFGDSILINFYELKKINPKLDYYEKIEPAITDDNSIHLYYPPGPGIAFVIDENGDIYAMLRILKEEDTAFPSSQKKSIHPELGEIYYNTVYFRDPKDRFVLNKWFAGLTLDEIKVEEGDRIEPGFVLEKMEIEVDAFFGMLKVKGTIYNDTGNDYHFAFFEITFFDANSNIVGEGMLQVSDISDGQSSSFTGGFVPDKTIELDEISYKIKFGGGM